MDTELSHEPFPFDFDAAYKAEGWGGIAWRAYAYESEADEDTEWTGYVLSLIHI